MTADNSPIPIFLLGLQRSGTTWLANMLCAHPEVAGVQSAEHHGIHESIFFSHFARAYGDLADDRVFQRFTTEFVASDYYILTGIEPDWLWHTRPTSYPEAFRLLMDEFARRRGTRFWLEKSPHHTLLCTMLAAAFSDARFVCVVRRAADLVRSRLWAFGRQPPAYPARLFAIVRACAANELFGRVLRKFSARCPRSILVSYEALSEDRPRELRRIADFLGLKYEDALFVSPWAPNTSFADAEARRRAFGKLDQLVVTATALALRLIPLALLKALKEGRTHAVVIWPDWCWTRMPRPLQPEDQD